MAEESGATSRRSTEAGIRLLSVLEGQQEWEGRGEVLGRSEGETKWRGEVGGRELKDFKSTGELR